MIDALLEALPLSYPDAVVVTGTAALGFVAGALGPFAVLRGRSMFGDAMSHATLPGVALAFLLTGAATPELLLLGAALSATAAALVMSALHRARRIGADTAIGVVLALALTSGLVAVTHAAGAGGQHAGLEEYLLGHAAGMVARDVVLITVIGAGALLVAALGFRLLRATMVDPQFAAVVGVRVWAVDALATALLAVAVVLGVRTVGAILMAALLVAPCVAARQVTTTLARLVPLAGLLGAICGVAGGVLAGRAELPAGPVIVLLATAVAVGSVLLAPGRGVLARIRAAR